MIRCDVVYKLNCWECDTSYVGQTKRKLKTRIKNHKNDVDKNNGILSVVSEHRLEEEHDFEWNTVEILDVGPLYHKKLLSEMIHIKNRCIV